MQKTHIILPEIKLIGITTRTNNKNEFDPDKSKIEGMVEEYLQNELSKKILYKKNSGVTYCVYTGFESDLHGEYTYFIGEEVNKFSDESSEFVELVIPKQNYIKFTIGPGKMPDICIEMWKQIWQMSSEDFGGTRSYIADFELYDERSKDPDNTTLDIFIGIK